MVVLWGRATMLSGDRLQYDKISKEYSSLAEVDVLKKYSQYPTVIKLLGNLSGKHVLDVGCGSGIISRELARRGANVVGYDVSKKQIMGALEEEKKKPLNIRYFISDPFEFTYSSNFDKAVSGMVLSYALNKKHLTQFFISTYKHLKETSAFVSIVFNPRFKRLNQILYNRRWLKIGRDRIRVEFFNNEQQMITSAICGPIFSVSDYEECAKEAGFKRISWEKLQVEKEGLDRMGKDFWRGYGEDCPNIALIVKKDNR